MRYLAKWPLALQVFLVLVWLWPIGVGGQMPIGGDVTSFSIGLMAELSRALHDWRLPVWNARWGYGFPGIGESQMGVFYPPHWLLYGLLPLEAAYTASIIFHNLAGTLGAYWCGRRFGLSESAAALNGFAWTTCGFFWIHLSHQWSYTTACWMPWCFGLAWLSARDPSARRAPYLLALLLAVQLLPGHFQIAFITQVGVVTLLFGSLLSRERAPWSVGKALIGSGFSFLPAAIQLWPTYRLSRMASATRDFDYLSGFAVAPIHLITFLAPGLFEVSPLWRPIIWDPFHTSPEEYLGFVGVVPLFLTTLAIAFRFRASVEVRALVLLALVTLWLALGPYVPGFDWLCRLPGFSFFRGPSRWIVATSLALTLLAGIGFDALGQLQRRERSLIIFSTAAGLICLAALLIVDFGLDDSGQTPRTGTAALYEKVLNALPWKEKEVYSNILYRAKGPNDDFRVRQAWARQGVELKFRSSTVFQLSRYSIYQSEIKGTLAVLFALVVVAMLPWNERVFTAALICVAVADLFWNGRPKRIDHAPIRSLVEQSPVLKRLADDQSHPRTLDVIRNLPIVADASPVAAYRTLDLPVLQPLVNLALKRPTTIQEEALVDRAAHALGVSIRIYDPFGARQVQGEKTSRFGWGNPVDIEDPNLNGWLHGVDLVRPFKQQTSTFRLEQSDIDDQRGRKIFGWLLPATAERLEKAKRDGKLEPIECLDFLKAAKPIFGSDGKDPSELILEVPALEDRLGDEPRLVILCQLYDPQWIATWNDQATPIFRVFGEPGQGAWTGLVVDSTESVGRLRLIYNARDVREGAWITGAASLVWLLAFWRDGRNRYRRRASES